MFRPTVGSDPYRSDLIMSGNALHAGANQPPATFAPLSDSLQPIAPSNSFLPGQRLQAEQGEGCSLLSIAELREMRGIHDPALRGTEFARYAEWDGTRLAIREILSAAAHYLEVGGTPWTPNDQRRWAAWVAFATIRGLDVRTDADAPTLAAFALAMLENYYATKTVRDHLRAIVRMVYGVGPETKTSSTAAALGGELTRAWAREGLEKHRRVAPVIPLGHIIALAAHLRDTADVEGWWVVAAAYARALRPIETLRVDPASVEVADDALRAHVTHTKNDPAAGEILDLPRLRDGWGDGQSLDVGAAWTGLVAAQGGMLRSSWESLRARVQKAAKTVGLPEWAMRTPRRSRATHMLLNGVDLPTIMWLLRHASAATTDRYIDALWAYGYDPHRSARVLLNQDRPEPSSPNATPPGKPKRSLAAVASSEKSTDQLRDAASAIVAKHRTERRSGLSARHVTKSREALERCKAWVTSNLGRDLDLSAPEADLIVAMWATATLTGHTPYSSKPTTVEGVVAKVLLHAPEGPGFWQTKQVMSGALRSDDSTPKQPDAATAADVIARIIPPTGRQPTEIISAARTNLILAMMWGSAGRLSDLLQVRQSTMFHVEEMGTVALLSTSKGGRDGPCPRDVLLFPDRDDDLDVRAHIDVLGALRAKHGRESDWLLACCDRPAAKPPLANALGQVLASRSKRLGLPYLGSHATRIGRTCELAEAGATQPELQRWLRHGTADRVSIYTRQADPAWLWRSAMRFVEQGR